MSGIMSGVDYSVLFSGSFAGTSGSANLLNTLYGGGAAGGAAGSGDPIAALATAQKNQTADIAQEAKTPTVARDIAAFQTAVAKSPDIATALKNPAVLKVLLTASNLADQLPYPALVQKALLSNLKDPNSLANTLTDSRWKDTASTYDFFDKGLAALKDPKTQATLTNAYAEVSWLNTLDATTPGLSSALTFKQQASTIKTADDILGNPLFRDVVTTAYGIPRQIAFQELGAQENAITSKLDIKQLQDPKFVNSLTDRYLLAKQQAASSAGSSGPDLISLSVQAAGIVA